MLGEHAPFIIASYVAAVLVIGGLILRMVLDQRTQKRALAELEARGAGGRRRSGQPSATPAPTDGSA